MDTKQYDHITGRINNNGKKLIDLWAFHMVIGGIIFFGKRIINIARVSLDQTAEYEIDYIFTNMKFRRFMVDVRPKNEADSCLT